MPFLRTLDKRVDIMSDSTYIHKDTLFIIVGNHPHAGEMCHVVGADKDHVHRIIVTPGEYFYEVKLLDCPHGMTGCFVKMANLRKVTMKAGTND